MHNITLILTLTAGLTVALAFGLLAYRLKLPPIVGYLIGGILIGPYTPGFVANRETAEQLAEIGVILLMFGVGLHFHLQDLKAVRNVAIAGALGQIAFATGLGVLAAKSFGWSLAAGLVFGIALSVASTVVLTRVLAEHGALKSKVGRIAIGWLVVEDIFTVFVLVLLPAILGTAGADPSRLAIVVGLSAIKLVALTALILGAGGRLLPGLLSRVAGTRSPELFTLAVLTIALGIAVLSAGVFGVSMALGAFLAGMVVGQSEFSYRAGSDALPLRDAFAVLFFVSVGMLFDPGQLIAHPHWILLTCAIVLIGKPLIAIAIMTVLGHNLRVSLPVSISLAQVGEFSFIVASLGTGLKVLPEAAHGVVIAAAIVSITLNPLLYRLIPGVLRRLAASPRYAKYVTARAPAVDNPASSAHVEPAVPRAIVVGYGPVGRAVVQLLQRGGIEPLVIDLNIENVRDLLTSGVQAVYGDAGQASILRESGLEAASALVLTAHGFDNAADIVALARQINPDIKIFARVAFASAAEPLRTAGADRVFSAEAEVALAMVEALQTQIQTPPDRAAEERRLLRADLYRLPVK